MFLAGADLTDATDFIFAPRSTNKWPEASFAERTSSQLTKIT